MIMTEHAESMDEDKIKEFVSECKALSDDNLVIIPGLEFICDNNLHILGLGIEKNFVGSDPEGIIDQIHANNGLAVLAHIKIYDSIPIKKLRNLDGVEIWNSRYDGRFAPPLKHFSILKKFREENNNILGYGGIDLHNDYEFGKLSICLNLEEMSSRNVVDALKKGNFYFTNGFFVIYPGENPKTFRRIVILMANLLYDITNRGVYISKKLFETFSIKPPKKILRIFQVIFR